MCFFNSRIDCLGKSRVCRGTRDFKRYCQGRSVLRFKRFNGTGSPCLSNGSNTTPDNTSELRKFVNSSIAITWRSLKPSWAWNTAIAGIPSSIGYFSLSISKARTDSTPTGRNSSCSLVVTSDIGGETDARVMIMATQIKRVMIANQVLLNGKFTFVLLLDYLFSFMGTDN